MHLLCRPMLHWEWIGRRMHRCAIFVIIINPYFILSLITCTDAIVTFYKQPSKTKAHFLHCVLVRKRTGLLLSVPLWKPFTRPTKKSANSWPWSSAFVPPGGAAVLLQEWWRCWLVFRCRRRWRCWHCLTLAMLSEQRSILPADDLRHRSVNVLFVVQAVVPHEILVLLGVYSSSQPPRYKMNNKTRPWLSEKNISHR